MSFRKHTSIGKKSEILNNDLIDCAVLLRRASEETGHRDPRYRHLASRIMSRFKYTQLEPAVYVAEQVHKAASVAIAAAREIALSPESGKRYVEQALYIAEKALIDLDHPDYQVADEERHPQLKWRYAEHSVFYIREDAKLITRAGQDDLKTFNVLAHALDKVLRHTELDEPLIRIQMRDSLARTLGETALLAPEDPEKAAELEKLIERHRELSQ